LAIRAIGIRGNDCLRITDKATTTVKLRIRDNSVRLRLMRSEVDALRESGEVSASAAFPGSRKLDYRVESSPASVRAAAFFSDNTLTVRLPEADVVAWATTEQVAMEDEQTLDDGDSLKILVEKDFVCLTAREGEDESEMYPHPDADKISC